MKKFEAPELEIEKFQVQDVITASTDEDNSLDIDKV